MWEVSQIRVAFDAEKIMQVSVHLDCGDDIHVALAGVGDDLSEMVLREARVRVEQRITTQLDVAFGIEELLIALPSRGEVRSVARSRRRCASWAFAARIDESSAVAQCRPVDDRCEGQTNNAVLILLHHLQNRLHSVVESGGRLTRDVDTAALRY